MILFGTKTQMSWQLDALHSLLGLIVLLLLAFQTVHAQQPRLEVVDFSDVGFKIRLTGEPRIQYNIERAIVIPDLWSDWAVGVSEEGVIEFTDTDPILPGQRRYYRARRLKFPVFRAELSVTSASPQFSEGAIYPPFRQNLDRKPNEAPPTPAPEGPLRGNLQPFSSATRVELYNPNGVAKPIAPVQTITGLAVSDPVVFGQNTSLGPAITPPDVPDMSGAANDSVVLMSGNFFGALSTDSGGTFTALDPTTIFPSTPTRNPAGNLLDNGFCCDQVIHYVPQIDRFIWLMQFWPSDLQNLAGQNMLRIASASTSDVINSRGTAWTYWDLRSDVTFRLGNQWFDYPDVSVGNNFLYVNATTFVNGTTASGRLVMRIPLAEIQASSVIHIDFTDPAHSAAAFHSHLTQIAGNAVYWAGHVNTSQMRIWTLPEGSNFYSWEDVLIFSWPVAAARSLTPSAVNWLEFPSPGQAIIGATQLNPTNSAPELWFAWTAGAGGGFPHPHIQIARFDAGTLSFMQQLQIWNPDHAFAYPALASNTRGEVGLAVGFGGGPFEASSAVGIWGDFLVYTPGFSTSSEDRFGDYLAVRQYAPRADVFSASIYNRLNLGSGNTYNPISIRFGRRSETP